MAPTYKLTYFNIKGLGEPLRYLFAYGGVDYVDNRITGEEWAKLKPDTPFGKMPLLEVDGKLAYQSSGICRYLAKKFNLWGNDEWESLLIDSAVDTITDLRLAINGWAFEEDAGVKAKKKETLFKETLPFYLSRLDKSVQENGGYFVGGKLTWADLQFASFHDFMSALIGRKLTDGYPNLQGVVQKVEALPAIKAWIAKRPVTDW